jgi:hypothetical protein
MAVYCFVARMRDRWACCGVFISSRTTSPAKKKYLSTSCTRMWLHVAIIIVHKAEFYQSFCYIRVL